MRRLLPLTLALSFSCGPLLAQELPPARTADSAARRMQYASLEQVLALVQAGASLLGTSSAPQLLRQLRRPANHNRHGELSS